MLHAQADLLRVDAVDLRPAASVAGTALGGPAQDARIRPAQDLSAGQRERVVAQQPREPAPAPLVGPELPALRVSLEPGEALEDDGGYTRRFSGGGMPIKGGPKRGLRRAEPPRGGAPSRRAIARYACFETAHARGVSAAP